MTIVRQLKIEELPKATELFCKFWLSIKDVPKDSDYKVRIKNKLVSALHSSESVILVDDSLSSVLCGTIIDNELLGYKAALELGWWIEPSIRSLKLANTYIHVFEDWALGQGARSVIFGSEASLKSPGILYKRQGYLPFEVTYKKDF